MEIKPAGKIPYTEKIFNEYKLRLADTLRKRALNSDQIFGDPDIKNFITSYMETELLAPRKDTERLITNTNIRLAHMEINTSSGKQIFPIVNEYKNHHPMKTYYFYKDEHNVCKMGCVEVNPKSIIISH
jgi:hypothetical protein